MKFAEIQDMFCAIFIYNFDVNNVFIKLDINHFFGYLSRKLRQVDIDFNLCILIEPAVLSNLLDWHDLDLLNDLSLIPGSNEHGVSSMDNAITVKLLGIVVVEILSLVIVSVVI